MNCHCFFTKIADRYNEDKYARLTFYVNTYLITLSVTNMLILMDYAQFCVMSMTCNSIYIFTA